MSDLPNHNIIKAWLYKIAGCIVLLAGFWLAFKLNFRLIIIIPCFICYLLLRHGKKYSVKGGTDELKNDKRAPVLYLRSFNDETDDRSMFNYFKALDVPKGKDLAASVYPVGFREQDTLGYLFRKVGPYIALGKPGEALPELGTNKIYVPNEEWQNTIRGFLKEARLIIFRAGKTEGLKWELNELVKTTNPKKIVVILPVKDEDYNNFIEWANPVMPTKFTVQFPASRMIIFDENWQQSCLQRKNTVTNSFAPFLQQNGITIKETFWNRMLEGNGLRW